ncbi:MAG: tRNA (N6-threonylcarbamoyladenosine(37)-N6)-methyltransferase TrmO [Bryobacterales bacterium]|nr:tRNA (N6-threonylcarbamoyladenosine(37)-N6)-methyltransferase TrmO [Bryobacterales bacterium]
MDKELVFIGEVRSEIRNRKDMPPLGGPAVVEIYPQFAEGLLRMEKHSHIWVMAWLMARPERDVLQVVPRGVEANQPDAMHGVFAVRSPARPNPIGLTACRLVRREGLRLEVDYLDFLDATPVIDVKPYFVSRDLIFAAHSRQVGRPRSREALRESLLLQALRFVPERHPDVALAVRILEHHRVQVTDWREPEQWALVLPGGRPLLVDAMIGMTRAGLSSGLRLGGGVSINGTAYALRECTFSFEETLGASDIDLFAVFAVFAASGMHRDDI